MVVCSACGRELRPEWRFCIHCGAAVHRAPVPLPAVVQPDLDLPELDAPPVDHAVPGRRPIEPTAIISLVLGILFSPFALIFGHVALVQQKRTGRGGRLIAIIGTVLGYGWTVLAVAILVSLLLVPRG